MIKHYYFAAFVLITIHVQVMAKDKQYNWQKSPGADVYRRFNEYCSKRFGAGNEPLVYKTYGQKLELLDRGSWRHVSENSACIGAETSLPAKTCIEYGISQEYGNRTQVSERFFYNHLHYLRGLQPGTTYHYRIVCVDERGKRLTSPDKTLKPELIPDAIHVPNDVKGPPYVLDKVGATYVLTQDLVVDGLAIDMPRKGVTFDLNGHTIIYNNKEMGKLKDEGFWTYINNSAFGIRTPGHRTGELKMLNGTIIQGEGNNGAQQNSYGFSPIYYRGKGNEIAGLTLIYAGAQMSAAAAHYGEADFHHNVIVDCGQKVTNRHQGCRAFSSGGTTKAHHNLVKRARHQGLSAHNLYCNEVYIDSCANNAFALIPASNGKVHSNKVFGTGYHVCGGGWGGRKCTRFEFRDNFIQLHAEKPSAERFGEYGARSNMVGLRHTLYGDANRAYDGCLYQNNVVIISSSQGGTARGMQISTGPNAVNRVCRNGTIKVIAEDSSSQQRCVSLEGNPKNINRNKPFLFEDMTMYGNVEHVRFGDGNAAGSNFQFHRCTFVRVGNDPRYKTIVFGYGKDTRHHVFRDCVLEGGASFDKVGGWKANEGQGFSVEWTVRVKTLPGAVVNAKAEAGQAVEAKANSRGIAELVLREYEYTGGDKRILGPYTVSATIKGRKQSKTIEVNKPETISLD